MRARLISQDELLGQSLIIGETARGSASAFDLEFPTTHRLIHHVTEKLGQTDAVPLELSLYGQIRVTWTPGPDMQTMVGEPSSGEPTEMHLVEGNHRMQVSIPRSDWYSKVIAPIGATDFLHVEIRIPKGTIGDAWRATATLLNQAERAYTIGDDAAVFNHLRGAFDSLPGAKQNIFDSLPEPKKSEIDSLVKALSQYLHAGRHVNVIVAGDKGFPVDHQDAGLAINLMKVLLSYVSQAIGAV